EVAWGANKAGPEMPLPDAVDDDAGGQRIGRFHDGLCQFPAAFSLLKWFLSIATKHGQKALGSVLAGHVRVAAQEHFLGVTARRFAEEHRARGRAGMIEKDAEELVLLVPQLVHVLAREVILDRVQLKRERRILRGGYLPNGFLIRIGCGHRLIKAGHQLTV